MNDISPQFCASRHDALARLQAFLPQAGLAYARDRNHDVPGHPHVSRLSPALRHRLITEAEVLAAVTRAQGDTAEKFMAEVLWRSYWKGFLELRPSLWAGYRRDLRAAMNRLATESGLRQQWQAACSGTTGIDGFDHWAQELVQTGYLHNHARMWFASIWIFTLRLPWELGADFFLRHLLDGDAASNTLSWRWVAGLHTLGKTYAATTDNIAKYTAGRFSPLGLARQTSPVQGQPNPAPGPCPSGDAWDSSAPSVLLVHEDDLSPDWLLDLGLRPKAVVLMTATSGRSPLITAPLVSDYVGQCMADLAARLTNLLGADVPLSRATDLAQDLRQISMVTGATQIVTPYAPVGPVADMLAPLRAAGLPLCLVMRPYDRALWPHATHGFFRFRAAVAPAIQAPA